MDLWSGSALLLALLLLIPLFAVVLGLAGEGPQWDHLVSTVLGTYVSNTVIVVILVTALAALLGIPTAWLVSNYTFPGRDLFQWALILPLAIPTYVGAFVYFQATEAAIPLLIEIRKIWGVDAFRAAESILRYGILCLLMASVLYPYIYISARASFSQQRQQVLEAAQTLGRGHRSVFFTVALPMARPMLIAGASLVIMEVINDYGAVHFFGVPTVTEGIFRTWFGQGDRASALRIAAFVMLAIFLILMIEQYLRGKARFAETGNRSSTLPVRRLSRINGIFACVLCLVPLSLGFLFPAGQLLIWAYRTWSRVFDTAFLGHLINTLSMAGLTAVTLTAIALVMAYAAKIHSTRWLRGINGLALLGYAAPGAVVALGILVSFGTLDRLISASPENAWFPLLSGTLFAIGFAYCIRFLAVALHPLKSGMTRVCGSLDEASISLGRGRAATLWHINIPLLRGTLWAAFTLVFIDILKELPLTMILRPANFETMATTAFQIAMEGRIHECALPSLIILVVGALGLILINRLLLPENR